MASVNQPIYPLSDSSSRCSANLAGLGVVVIGRNEGERLKTCLRSLAGISPIVYVDSGSTDGSVAHAQSVGAEVVALDLSQPFTAARARNEGARRVQSLCPDLAFVQFVDGDCELQPGWLEAAQAELSQRSTLAAVCGRLRERFPEASIYNQLCDLEWDGPVGPTDSCGGIAMMRLEAFFKVGGFDPTLIAGEEPDLCLRLRQAGYGIERLGAEMALHDAAMHRFGQWWRRARRAGHAYAEVSHRHRREPEHFWMRDSRRIAFWGLALPSLGLGLSLPTLGLSSALWAGYPLLFIRTYRSMRRKGLAPVHARLYAAGCVLGKFPEAMGLLEYWFRHLTGRPSAIIEHKTPAKV